MLRLRVGVSAVVLTMLLTLIGLSAPAAAAAGTAASPKVTISASWMVKAGAATTLTGSVSQGWGHVIYLQYRVSPTKDAWSTLKTARVAANGTKGKIAFSFVPKSGERVYRVVLKKGTLRLVSNSITVRTTTGSVYVAKARFYMKKYCPSTPVTATIPKGPGHVGLAHTSWRVRIDYLPSGRIRSTYSWTQKIELQPGLPDPALKFVALHECAHIVQYRQMVKGEAYLGRQFAAADKLYGSPGIERQADCMAGYLAKSMTYSYYIHTCNAARVESGRKLWAAFGSKYQSPNYTWVTYQG